uniref:Zinc finger, CCHC-type n=1 Tax=Tanacetum cinerariifolium TaxID=118510 RepID=A0A6L2LGV8_TANCI|nr:zinc finger, CCHC-type [Tanacetum cinerariifolium]
MTGAKFDIKKFDGTGDFRLWRIKMRALLIQHGYEESLEVLPADMEGQTKAELNKKAHSVVILCLGSKVLREVIEETTAARVWLKLETLYMTKSLANKLYLKKKLYTIYMLTGRKNFEHVDEFNKIVLDLVNIEDHLKRNCRKNNRKKSPSYIKKDEQPISSGSSYDDSELGDNRECKIRGIGKVRIQLRDGSSFVLHNFRYIPTLKRNLISLRTLEKEGFTVKMQSGKVKVINGSRVVLSGIRRANCVYSLDGHAMAGELNASVEEKDSLTQVWHKRLRHINEVGLQVLEKQGLFGKKSLGSDRLCSFRLMGSVSGGIIGRFKHEAFGKFKEWKKLVKNQTGKMVKKQRTNNGLDLDFPRPSGRKRHVEVELKRLNNNILEEDDQENSDNEDAGDQENDQISDLTDYQLTRDREPRTRTKPLRFRDESNMDAYVFVVVEEEETHEPLTYQKAVACEDSSNLKATMKEEMDSLRKNKTRELVDHLTGKKLGSCKWLFKIRKGIEGVEKPRYKARLVAHGFTQRARIDYNKLDVKTAFLHGNLEEVIYLRQPSRYEQDDMMIACKRKAKIGSTKSLLKKEFDMKELGEAKKILDNWKSVKMPLGGHFKLSLKDCSVRDYDVERMEAKYMALTEDVKEAIWLRGLLEELGVELNTVAVNFDNLGAIHLLRNHVFHERTKHINVHYHFIREVLEAKAVKVLKVGTEHKVVDALTKVVLGLKLQHCLELLNVGGRGTLGGRDVGEFNQPFVGNDVDENLIWRKSDVFAFDDAVRVNTLELKKLMNFFRSRKFGVIWSFGILRVCKSTKIPFIREDGLAIEWNSKNLIELLKRESDEFVLNHEGDKNDSRVISLKGDLTIKSRTKRGTIGSLIS